MTKESIVVEPEDGDGRGMNVLLGCDNCDDSMRSGRSEQANPLAERMRIIGIFSKILPAEMAFLASATVFASWEVESSSVVEAVGESGVCCGDFFPESLAWLRPLKKGRFEQSTSSCSSSCSRLGLVCASILTKQKFPI